MSHELVLRLVNTDVYLPRVSHSINVHSSSLFNLNIKQSYCQNTLFFVNDYKVILNHTECMFFQNNVVLSNCVYSMLLQFK